MSSIEFDKFYIFFIVIQKAVLGGLRVVHFAEELRTFFVRRVFLWIDVSEKHYFIKKLHFFKKIGEQVFTQTNIYAIIIS